MAYEIENESDDDLDLSWIQEEQSLLAEPTTQSVKKVMSEIAFHCIYIGPNQEIVAHNRGLCPLDIHENHSTLSNARLLKYIKGNQCYDGIPYKFGDVILYHINIDFEHIQAFVSCGSAGTFTPISMFEDVVIQPSLILFHQINEIYMLYQSKSVSSIDVASILKTELTKKNTHTKKVRIAEEKAVTVAKKKHKHTRKKS